MGSKGERYDKDKRVGIRLLLVSMLEERKKCAGGRVKLAFALLSPPIESKVSTSLRERKLMGWEGWKLVERQEKRIEKEEDVRGESRLLVRDNWTKKWKVGV